MRLPLPQPAPAGKPSSARRSELRHNLAGDNVVRAEQRPERRSGVAELDRQPHVLGHRHAEAAELFGQRVAEQPEISRRGAQIVRDRIGLLDLLLARDHPLAHEPTHRSVDLAESIFVHDTPPTSVEYRI
jgi:hypothetical protein